MKKENYKIIFNKGLKLDKPYNPSAFVLKNPIF